MKMKNALTKDVKGLSVENATQKLASILRSSTFANLGKIMHLVMEFFLIEEFESRNLCP